MSPLSTSTADAPQTYAQLRRGVEAALLAGRRQIEQAKVRTYWETGRLINAHLLLNGDRADYGARVFTTLEADLNVSKRVLYQCARFARMFPIVNGRSQLIWAHYRALCQVEDHSRRKLLATAAVKNAWTAAQLEERIRPLNLAASGGNNREVGETKPDLLVPKRGTPGLHLIVDRGDGDLAVDLGFKLYRPLTADQRKRFEKGAIVRLTTDRLTRVDDATRADLNGAKLSGFIFAHVRTKRPFYDGDA